MTLQSLIGQSLEKVLSQGEDKFFYTFNNSAYQSTLHIEEQGGDNTVTIYTYLSLGVIHSSLINEKSDNTILKFKDENTFKVWLNVQLSIFTK